MEYNSCSCGDGCKTCKSCDTPKCECFCELYTEYEETNYAADEEDDDESYDEDDDDNY